ALVVALPLRADFQDTQPRVLLDVPLDVVPAIEKLHVALASQRRQRGVGEPARRRQVGGQDFIVEGRQLLVGARLPEDQRASRRLLALRRPKRLGGGRGG